MELVDFSKPGEKKKLIWAGVLGLVALIFLWWTFIGFGSSTPTRTTTTTTQTPPPVVGAKNRTPVSGPSEPQVLDVSYLEPVNTSTLSSNVPVPEPRRNIFAFYDIPKKAPTPVVTPTPTPTPPPPVLMTAISPSNVYAKTGEFNLEISGDKFTPEMRVYVDERELPSKYKSPQQMSATVSASIIASPGNKRIKVRTPDARAYSNELGLSVAPPPVPNYTYVGITQTQKFVSAAFLQDKSNKEILSVQLGDLLNGRFRVTSISEKEIVFVDSNLKIKHNIAMTEGERVAGSPSARPTPRVDAEDDEP